MTQADMLSINTVAAKLGLSVHQLRRWELMFGLEIKRGRGQQRQYRAEDLTVLERIKELVEQGWPTSQIRPQLEAEGLITPKLIGMPQQPGNPEMLMEAIIGLRTFAERRFIEISKQIDELRQLMISITLKQELRNEMSSPWQPVEEEITLPSPSMPAQEISIGPAVTVSMPADPDTEISQAPPPPPMPNMPLTPPPPQQSTASILEEGAPLKESKRAPAIGEITDQNYLTMLGKALDLIGWSDEQADQYSQQTFGVAHWDELGRSHAEKLIDFLVQQLEESNPDQATV
ncbi:MAG: helix-turn-helix domain-containing protein [Candidatus Obscuribacterales bacterium]|nr:helix-turn-helix domain-containing protein [Candidatus Obscuribacterales bacterium]